MGSADNSSRSRLAGAAYWAMMRRIVVVAGCIDAAWILLYAGLDAPFLAALNVASVALYAAAYLLIGQRRNRAAVTLVWLEVLVHSAAASLLIGWDSGFHYFLLLFIPAMVVGTARRWALPAVLLLLTFYVGLHALCERLGPLSPLQPWALTVAWWVNVALIFGFFYAMAAFYRATVIKAERRLLAAATTDGLTGLANRSHFQLRAAAELAHGQRNRAPTALVLADVDFFKRVNDDHGHDVGDKVLVQVGTVMRATLREVDVLARWGGEEFLALLPQCSDTTALEVAERLREAVAAIQIDVDGRLLQITASFGVAEVQDMQDLQAAIARADQALYRSKHEGRNRVNAAPPPSGGPEPRLGTAAPQA